ncbi:GntR family transcriptional regulator [Bacillus haynesii]|uniref:GntR family transcriptional regulator n=1 Tax=Bacillus TaxID=1386 RepID=UPI00227DD4AF|nr:GntR family transcriptional regulator [Bacillus haynesii]MCY7800829.1 GntR family transcriptional regulator [Bacillus haynesii]MCY7969497.1 GntR family transcriptional regulator [Bacillus haynesii]MCY7992882.1 GntR family transcriptional regulator [Bacillus haynesii]MCY8090504.1 GntR family transcriptional regulator [Bacillus haynesii]MCY8292922.1 GntR family transcriptional regulator [Bacillus haynesii]
MKFSIQRAVSYHDQVHHYLKDMIIKGGYQPGERIYESKIAKELQVSRSPVREAIRTLEQEGLLLIDDKSKITVYEPTIKDLEEIYQCRQALESLAVSLATRLASNETLALISETLSDAHKHQESQSPESANALLRLNTRFHDVIIEASENERLQKQLLDLRSLTFFYRSKNLEKPERTLDIINQHEEILSHMQDGNDAKAAESMRKHIEADLCYLKEVLFGSSAAR